MTRRPGSRAGAPRPATPLTSADATSPAGRRTGAPDPRGAARVMRSGRTRPRAPRRTGVTDDDPGRPGQDPAPPPARMTAAAGLPSRPGAAYRSARTSMREEDPS